MGGRGPGPKPAHLRQRQNRKPGAATLIAPARPKARAIPNPDGREWHPLTEKWWRHQCEAEMAGQWFVTDWDGLGMVAILVDDFYKGDTTKAAEIRLQGARFGLSPLDRSRLQWEVGRAEEAEQKRPRPRKAARTAGDPRVLVMPQR